MRFLVPSWQEMKSSRAIESVFRRTDHRSTSFIFKADARQVITIRAQYCHPGVKFYPRLLHSKAIVARQECHRFKDDYDIPLRYQPPLHSEKMRRTHNWPDALGQVKKDSKLMYDRRLRRWTFVWVYGKNVVLGENQPEEPQVVAIDPGVVNFVTWYSPTQGHGHVGHRDIERVVRLCLSLDDLISRTDKAPSSRKRSMRRAQARIRQHIRNLIDEVHKKTALWLVENFDVVVIPIFGSAKMSIRKPGRRLRRKSVRQMLTWGHARFRDRLISKAAEHGVNVITSVSEAYTSKTFTGCGAINNKLGGARVYRCSSCQSVLDRDVNGAKGILLRALVAGVLTSV